MDGSEGKRPVRFYEIVYVVVLLALLVLSVFFMNPHRVGTLDINRVAHELGIDKRIGELMKQQQESAVTRGQRIQQVFERQSDELDKKLKAAAGAAEKDKVQADIRNLQDAFQKNIGAIRSAVQRQQNLVFASFRKRLQPVVEAVARKRRLDVVLEPSVNVVYMRSQTDITADVVARARKVITPDLPLVDPSLTNQTSEAESAE